MRQKNTVLKTPRFVSDPGPIPPKPGEKNSLVVVYECHGIFGSNAHDGVVEDLP